MLESEACGMKHHALGRGVAIERVTHDGTAQTIEMGTVDAQLMCSASKREEAKARGTDYLKLRHRLLTILVVHPLHGAVLKIGRKRERKKPPPSLPLQGRSTFLLRAFHLLDHSP